MAPDAGAGGADGAHGVDYTYYVPDDTSVVDTWGFFGWWPEDPGNIPDEGLDGVYYSVTDWGF